MRLSVQKATNYPKELSYAVLAHGAATGVWTAQDWNTEAVASTRRAELKNSMLEAAKKASA